jgi:hypothetical protein
MKYQIFNLPVLTKICMVLYARVTLGTMLVPSLRDLRGGNKVKMQPKWGKVAKLCFFDPEQVFQ